MQGLRRLRNELFEKRVKKSESESKQHPDALLLLRMFRTPLNSLPASSRLLINHG